jgi:hypothetical protein
LNHYFLPETRFEDHQILPVKELGVVDSCSMWLGGNFLDCGANQASPALREFSAIASLFLLESTFEDHQILPVKNWALFIP